MICSTRWGWSAATSDPHSAPQDSATRTAESVSVASSTATASAANSATAYAAARQPVATPAEGDHPGVARHVRDLHLPHPGVDDRPRRQEQDGRLAVPVDLVVDADAVAHDVAGAVGVPGPRLFAGPVLLDRGLRGRHQSRASKTMLKGVSATRRNRPKPALVTMSRIRASPAWAPSANPTG